MLFDGEKITGNGVFCCGNVHALVTFLAHYRFCPAGCDRSMDAISSVYDIPYVRYSPDWVTNAVLTSAHAILAQNERLGAQRRHPRLARPVE